MLTTDLPCLVRYTNEENGITARVPFRMITNLLLWDSSTICSEESVARANDYIEAYPLFKQNLELEIATMPIIDPLMNNGICLDAEWWYRKEILPREERLSGLAMEDLDVPRADLSASEKVEFKDLHQFIKRNWISLNANGGLLKNVGLRSFLPIQGWWEHYSGPTGRFSATASPVMALPKKMKAYLSPMDEDRGYFSSDLCNIELRIASALTGTTQLQEMFHAGTDVHFYNGQWISVQLGLSLDDATTHRLGKKFVYAVLYGCGDQTLAKSVSEVVGSHIDSTQMATVRATFMQKYPELEAVLKPKDLKKLCTPFGDVPINIDQTVPQRINLPVQFIASRLFKEIMVSCVAAVGDDAMMVLPIHDEMVWDMPLAKAELLKSTIIETIEATLSESWPELEVTGIVEFSRLGSKVTRN
ncbi:DNA polymerase [Levilactobacillus brevis]|uniref:DNA polymerase n=1 Tax=Levilactobacillus brevis TaxID=1580 RepID=UPI0011648C54|nr:DNA polymerase [Levilactobacillus brevis]QCZ46819.1 Hypothetical protein UCCLB556_1944 [Levilactobacillus brevis]